jgi:hypothetical protein
VLTAQFENDKKRQLIYCNPKQQGARGYRRVCVLLGETCSQWTRTFKEAVNESVGFRTVFKMYVSANKEYFLQIVGESDHREFSNRYKVIKFKSPGELYDILSDTNDKRVYLSEPVMELIELLVESPYLDDRERELWDNGLFL